MKLRFISTCILGIAVFVSAQLHAQTFEKLDRSKYMDMNSFVDPFADPLGNDSEPLTINNEKWNVLYWKQIRRPRYVTNSDGYPLHRITTDRNGKQVDSYVWESPSVYFIIADMPGNSGRFHGLITTGFDDIQTVMDKPQSKWQKGTIVKPVIGTIVKPDGHEEDFFMKTASQMQKTAIKSPVGSYWYNGWPSGFKGSMLTFQPGGTGTITFYRNQRKVNIIGELAGTRTKNKRTGKWGRRGNEMTGGYRIYIDPVGTLPIKWKYTDGELAITPAGKPTVKINGGVDFHKSPGEQEQYYANDAEQRLHQQQQSADYRTNEHVQKENNISKTSLTDYLLEFKEFSIYPKVITRTDMLASMSKNGSVTYLPSKKPSDDDLYQKNVYSNASSLKSSFIYSRDCGIEKIYNNFTNDVRRAILRDTDTFGDNPEYEVDSINVLDRTANVTFYGNSKYGKARLVLNPKGQLDKSVFNSSFVDMSEANELTARANELYNKIMSYKDDKMRKKTVKEYEKRYKGIFPLAEAKFENKKQYEDLLNSRKELIKNLTESLNYLN